MKRAKLKISHLKSIQNECLIYYFDVEIRPDIGAR